MSAKPSTEELRERLTEGQFHVTQEGGTERAFTGCLWNEKREGSYSCIVCDTHLFESGTKYDSGSGWPSFWAPIEANSVTEIRDNTLGIIREEIVCSLCGGHLGHVFNDGPKPTGLRYCMNSVSLTFVPANTEELPDQ